MTGGSENRKAKGTRYYSGDYVREKLFIEDMPFKTKYGAAQACGGGSPALARYAASLQKRGDVEILLFSGGKRVFDLKTFAAIAGFQAAQKNWEGLRQTFHDAGNFLSLETEAVLMRRVAIEEGVSADKIIIEGQGYCGKPTSTNSAQNVENLLLDYDLRQDLIKEGEVSVLAHAYHTRRTCGTWVTKMDQAYKQANITKQFTVVARSHYPFGFTPYNWEVPIIRQLVLREAFETDPDQYGALISRKPEDVGYYAVDSHLRRMEYRDLIDRLNKDPV